MLLLYWGSSRPLRGVPACFASILVIIAEDQKQDTDIVLTGIVRNCQETRSLFHEKVGMQKICPHKTEACNEGEHSLVVNHGLMVVGVQK